MVWFWQSYYKSIGSKPVNFIKKQRTLKHAHHVTNTPICQKNLKKLVINNQKFQFL